MILRLDQVRESANGVPIVLTSGCFDPLHAGHLQLFYHAYGMAPRFVVLVNSDAWIREWKRHDPFMCDMDRTEIIDALDVVDAVVLVDGDKHGTVAEAIREIRPAVFAKGGDILRVSQVPAAERRACAAVGCRIAVAVGGGKIRSSSIIKRRGAA